MWQVSNYFKHFTSYQPTSSNMSVEHPPISNIGVELTRDEIQETGERLHAAQHQAEFSTAVSQIGQLRLSRTHAEHADRQTLISALAHSRRFSRAPLTSGLPRNAAKFRAGSHFVKVP
jgi:hypothetical protein